MKTWIDFKELRASLDFEAVMNHYGVEVKRKGDQHHGFCPLPTHEGKRNSASFSAHLGRGIFQCFGCGAKGNVLEFAAMMAGVNPKDGAALHKVAIELQSRFRPADTPAKEEKSPKPRPKAAVGKQPALPVITNQPLDFELKQLDSSHPYLAGRGFSPETIAKFGLGYCSRGLLSGRIAIPLRDDLGNLIGYAGRLVDDSAITPENPKYLLPPKREREGTVHEFKKSLFVYNGHRLARPVDDLIVVEGFPATWWLSQCGFANVVAVMGADCSDRQAEIIVAAVKPGGRVWVMPDGNEAGLRCAESILSGVVQHRFVRWVRLQEDNQPTNFNHDQLKQMLTV